MGVTQDCLICPSYCEMCSSDNYCTVCKVSLKQPGNNLCQDCINPSLKGTLCDQCEVGYFNYSSEIKTCFPCSGHCTKCFG
jgi:hypothetical protein